MTEGRRLEPFPSLASEESESAAPESGPPCTLLSEDEILDYSKAQLEAGQLRRISKHVRGCKTCQFLVEAALRAEHPRTIPVDVRGAWNANFPPGILLAERYLVLGFVGKGAMGEVYEALDNTLKQRRLALKTVVATASDSPRAESRLRDEVLIAQLISHPNVCRIHNLEVHREENELPVLFFAMEFIEGESLGRRLRSHGPLAVDEALHLARQLLHGLQAAHDANVLHRDFKSDNVMLRSSHDKALQPVITDFGLARALDSQQNLLTSDSRHLVGTIPYMAPEQLRGDKLGPQADLFAFGVVLYEMLTGNLPFKGGVRQQPVRPSRARREISPLLDAFVLKCLKLEPAERYASAADALVDLGRIGRAQPRWRLWAPAVGVCALAAITWWMQARSTPTAVPTQEQLALVPDPASPALVPAPSSPAERTSEPSREPAPESLAGRNDPEPTAARGGDDAPARSQPGTARGTKERARTGTAAPLAPEGSGTAEPGTAAHGALPEPLGGPGSESGAGVGSDPSVKATTPPQERLLDPFATESRARQDAGAGMH